MKFGGDKALAAVKEMLDGRAQHDKLIKKYGWVCHMVVGNTHTHGLLEEFQHPDLQCVLNIEPSTIHAIFCKIVKRISEGDDFQSGIRYKKIINTFDVIFIDAVDDGRDVLRLIFPDATGSLEAKNMSAEKNEF